jgi:hypothetical protein
MRQQTMIIFMQQAAPLCCPWQYVPFYVWATKPPQNAVRWALPLQGLQTHNLPKLLSDDKDEEGLWAKTGVIGHPAAEEGAGPLLSNDALCHL